MVHAPPATVKTISYWPKRSAYFVQLLELDAACSLSLKLCQNPILDSCQYLTRIKAARISESTLPFPQS